jgi:hypothetical protein
MPSRLHRRGLALVLLGLAGLAVSALAVVTVTVTAPPADAAGAPVVPQRLVDTRSGSGARPGPLAPGEVLTVPVAGRAGVPAGATGVALNVTVTEATAAGYLTAYPCGGTVPPTSSVNVGAGGTAAATVIVGIGSGGAVCLRASMRTQVVVDLSTALDPGGPFVPLSAPARLVDTRPGLGAPARPVAPGEVVRVPVAGRPGVPAGATAAVLTLTATEPAGAGFVAAFPCGQSPPATSNVNVVAGLTVANAVVVGLGAGGAVCVLASTPTHLVVDLTGTMSSAGFAAVAPARLLDTRVGIGAAPGRRGWRTGRRTELMVAGAGGLPGGAGRAVLNLTVTEPDDSGYVAAWPCDQRYPGTSAVNFEPGQTVANLAVVPAGNDGRVCLFVYTAHGGTAHVIADATGWIPGPQAPPAGRFGWIGLGGTLPSAVACAADVRPAPERVRANAAANATTGASHVIANQPPLLATATGDFTGTTDEIIQWAACKWGYDEDVLRAQVYEESAWRMDAVGDMTTTAAYCSPDKRGTSPCPQAVGLLQVWYRYHAEAWPDYARSTAYQLDLVLAEWRSCVQGDLTYLAPQGYRAGDLWGCVGRYNSGEWHDARGDGYVSRVQATLAAQRWMALTG